MSSARHRTLRGDFGDNYYYQLCDFIRRYKGVEPTPVYSAYQTIDSRRHAGMEQSKSGIRRRQRGCLPPEPLRLRKRRTVRQQHGTERHSDAKVANDGKTLYFYVRTAAPVTPFSDPKWMRLFLDVKGSESGNWEGFSTGSTTT